MFASLRALLSGIIDYAGLFPPAGLSLDQAIRNYARYRQEADAWMLGRFVIPAARLAELEPYHELFSSGPPFAFAALGRGGATAEECRTGLIHDLPDLAAFRERHGVRVTVDVLEVRLPADFADPHVPESTSNLKILHPFTLYDVLIFYEAQRWPSALVSQLKWLTGRKLMGFKLRCGGSDASAFPPSEQIAADLLACRDAGMKFKATAGLHHPLPRFDAALNVRMHGFVNLFLAGALARARNLGVEQIRAILDDDCPEHFMFDDEGASWRDVRASTAEIAAARREFMISFGSCSFDEPLEDLRSLGWL